ncbi:YVTN repeat-like/Quino protein amine dehydrogenase [Coniophora puteana RWD-64-598 SS2]|uniref:YVTN repeat-like/Quino protein amine dehydrogenase n=1 Tax=Coniophora puteana (strain RWD-64-598) TaxID=741705 RepID=A0A5M3MGV6_CONPW|nr:YVTN repeat-like/Quino protein amine dehydrogenase [Coniophora puteana RWD-64-598 SS2]EIW78236.1 YVTN repeat-like/Quino protein amine dehydrogenase [Coniophora puteana RWD-64-598 SS2]
MLRHTTEPQPFAGHTRDVTCIEYSPDGQLLATGTSDGHIHLWDSQNGKLFWLLTPALPVHSISFSPSGRHFAAICKHTRENKACVFVWDLMKDRNNEAVDRTETAYEGERVAGAESYGVRFSWDGKVIAVMTSRRVVLQDTSTGKVVKDVAEATEKRRFEALLAFSSDDRSVLYAYRDQAVAFGAPLEVRAFDLILKQDTSVHLSIPFARFNAPHVSSPDGTLLAGVASAEGIHIWSSTRGPLNGPLIGHDDETTCMCFSADAAWVIDGSDAKTICVWDTSTGKLALGPLRNRSQHEIRVLACSPLKERIACVDASNNVNIWDVKSGKIALSSLPIPALHRAQQGRVEAIHWLPDGRHFMSSGRDDNYICVWDAETGRMSNELLSQGGCYVALSPDGTLLAAGSSRRGGNVILLDPATGKQHGSPLMATYNWTRKLSFSASGSVLAVLFEKSSSLYLVHDVLGNRTIRSIQDTGIISDVAFSPDGQSFAYTTQNDGKIRICDVRMMAATAELTSGRSDLNHSLSFSPDGLHLLSASEQGHIGVWNLATRQVQGLSIPLVRTRQTSYSPDGKTFLRIWRNHELDAGVELFNVTNGSQVWKLEEQRLVTTFAFAPQGDRVAIGLENGSMKVYDIATGKMILPRGDGQSAMEEDKKEETSKREAAVDDVDDDSLMNMPAAFSNATRARLRASTDPQLSHARAQNTQRATTQDTNRPRLGLVARLTSRFLGPPTAPGSGKEHHRWPRAMRLVSVAKSKTFIAAAGDSTNPRGQRSQTRADDDVSISSTSSESQQQETTVPDRALEIQDRSSSVVSDHGCWDTIKFCTCWR